MKIASALGENRKSRRPAFYSEESVPTFRFISLDLMGRGRDWQKYEFLPTGNLLTLNGLAVGFIVVVMPHDLFRECSVL